MRELPNEPQVSAAVCQYCQQYPLQQLLVRAVHPHQPLLLLVLLPAQQVLMWLLQALRGGALAAAEGRHDGILYPL
jgi:hypothetical protein